SRSSASRITARHAIATASNSRHGGQPAFGPEHYPDCHPHGGFHERRTGSWSALEHRLQDAGRGGRNPIPGATRGAPASPRDAARIGRSDRIRHPGAGRHTDSPDALAGLRIGPWIRSPTGAHARRLRGRRPRRGNPRNLDGRRTTAHRAAVDRGRVWPPAGGVLPVARGAGVRGTQDRRGPDLGLVTTAGTSLPTAKPGSLDEQLLSRDFLQDPYPTHRRIRREDPVHWCEPWRMWMVSRYEDVRTVLLKDGTTFSAVGQTSAALAHLSSVEHSQLESLQRIFSAGLLWSDPPDHTRIRSAVNKALTPHDAERMRPRLDGIIASVVDELPVGEAFDFVERVAAPVPVSVLAALLGLRDEDVPRF